MKLAVFSDIHSNHLALEAAIARAESVGVDGMIFLGDYVSDCPNPQATMKLLAEIRGRYRTWFIRGNREEYLLNHDRNPEDGWKYCSRTGSLLYTYENLTREDLEWFGTLPNQMRIEIEGTAPFEICHGSLRTTRCMLMPGTVYMDELLSDMQTNLLLCAHTHHDYIFEHEGKTVVNVGVVGVPSDNRTGAEFAIIEYDGVRWNPTLMHAEYDVESAVREFYADGFIEKANVWARGIAATLRTGRGYTEECLRMVSEFFEAEGGGVDDEALWERAARRLGI